MANEKIKKMSWNSDQNNRVRFSDAAQVMLCHMCMMNVNVTDPCCLSGPTPHLLMNDVIDSILSILTVVVLMILSPLLLSSLILLSFISPVSLWSQLSRQLSLVIQYHQLLIVAWSPMQIVCVCALLSRVLPVSMRITAVSWIIDTDPVE